LQELEERKKAKRMVSKAGHLWKVTS